jgi:D-alanyl-D-alanine dipeptidase
MSRAGFWVLRDEWWHFVSEDVKSFAPVEMPLSDEPGAEPSKP